MRPPLIIRISRALRRAACRVIGHRPDGDLTLRGERSCRRCLRFVDVISARLDRERAARERGES